MTKKTILILGVSSFIGSSLAEYLKKNYRVVGTYFNHAVEIEDVLSIRCDIHNEAHIKKWIGFFKPDFTIYAAGLFDLKRAHDNPKLSDHLNTSAIFNISRATELYRSRLIYLSSSFIFSGDEGVIEEDEAPKPITIYGNSVASAEFYIQKSCLNYLIFRMGAIFGRGINPDKMNILEKLEFASLKKIELRCDDKIKTNFASTTDLAASIEEAIEHNLINQVVHIGSQDIMSQLEFAQLYKELRGGSFKIEEADFELPLIHTKNIPEKLFFNLRVRNSDYSIRESLKKFLNLEKKANLKLI